MKSLLTRQIAALLVIGLMLLPGVGFFVPEDVNHDREIDIRDAVIRLQMVNHSESYGNARGAEKGFAACENILKAVAGLKEIVAPAFETEHSVSSHFCFLISSIDVHPVFLNFDAIIEHSFSFSSVLPSPPYQPPIFS